MRQQLRISAAAAARPSSCSSASVNANTTAGHPGENGVGILWPDDKRFTRHGHIGAILEHVEHPTHTLQGESATDENAAGLEWAYWLPCTAEVFSHPYPTCALNLPVGITRIPSMRLNGMFAF